MTEGVGDDDRLWSKDKEACRAVQVVQKDMEVYTKSFSEVPPDLGDAPTFRQLRPALKYLDLRVAHSFQAGPREEWKSLSIEVMSTVYKDRRQHMKGELEMRDWIRNVCNGMIPGEGQVGCALAFWHNLDGTDQLPYAAVVGLASTQLGGFEATYLLSYQTLTNVPAHVVCIDAAAVLPRHEFEAKLAAGSEKMEGFIALLADIVKMWAFVRIPTFFERHEVVNTIDVDVLWFRRNYPPRRAYGHAFGTHALNKSTRRNRQLLQYLAEERTVDYCICPRDFLALATPYRFPKGSPFLQALAQTFEGYFDGDSWSPPDFDDLDKDERFLTAMRTVSAQINISGLRGGYNNPDLYCPVEYYRWNMPLNADTARIEAIFVSQI